MPRPQARFGSVRFELRSFSVNGAQSLSGFILTPESDASWVSLGAFLFLARVAELVAGAEVEDAEALEELYVVSAAKELAGVPVEAETLAVTASEEEVELEDPVALALLTAAALSVGAGAAGTLLSVACLESTSTGAELAGGSSAILK